MKKEITAQQFKDLPRATKRALQRDLHKKGLKTPVIRERVSVAVLVDKELYLKALKILEIQGIEVPIFFDLALSTLINETS